MKKGRLIGWAVVAGIVLLALYDVDFVFDIAMPGEAKMPDPAIEAAYQGCYETRDDDIHSTAFGTIDNPDVQKEFITTQRAIATRECRQRHPQTMVSVETPGRFNVVDLSPRFW